MIIYKTKKTTQQIEDEYWHEMMRGCMHDEPNQKTLDNLKSEYEYSSDQLMNNILRKQVHLNLHKILDGSGVIKYST